MNLLDPHNEVTHSAQYISPIYQEPDLTKTSTLYCTFSVGTYKWSTLILKESQHEFEEVFCKR